MNNIFTPELATLGRNEIDITEKEMAGLMTLRKKFMDDQPLKKLRITGCMHMTIQTSVLIETLNSLGAQIRWCSCNIFSTQDHAAAAIMQAHTAEVFAWKGETVHDYWNCIDKALTWDGFDGPDLIIDDGADVSLLIHEGIKYEKHFTQTNEIFSLKQENVSEDEYERHLLLVKSLKSNNKRWHRLVDNLLGASEQTTTGIKRLAVLAAGKSLLFPIIDVNGSVTKSKFDNIYGCRHSLIDGLYRATDLMLAGKKALICGYGDVGKGCAMALKGAGMRVYVSEIDPICALQALMQGFEVVTLEDVQSECHVFVTATGNCNIIRYENIEKMRDHAILANIGHFNNEIDVKELAKRAKKRNIKPHVDLYSLDNNNRVLLLADGRLVNLSCATGHPSFVMSCSFMNQVFAQIELASFKSKKMDEMVAQIHVEALGGRLTKLSQVQSDYINVPITGPFKDESYRY